MENVISVHVKDRKEISFPHLKSYEIVIKVSPDFMNETEGKISTEVKNELISQKVKEAFLKNLFEKGL